MPLGDNRYALTRFPRSNPEGFALSSASIVNSEMFHNSHKPFKNLNESSHDSANLKR
jgi:hypothetical protein